MTTSKLYIHTRPLQTCRVSCSLVPPRVCPIETSNLKFQIQTPDIPLNLPLPQSSASQKMAFFHVLNLKTSELALTLPHAITTFNAIRKSPQPCLQNKAETSEFSPSPLLTPWATPASSLASIISLQLNVTVVPKKLQLLYSYSFFFFFFFK